MIHWELIIAICGLLIALATAITTIWQGFLTRKHNRLSVKPILKIEQRILVNEKASIILKNTGVGPAIIRSVPLYFNKKFISTLDNISAQDLSEKLDLSALGINMHALFSGDSFGIGEDHFLIETQEPIPNEGLRKRIEDIFNCLYFPIQYESIYDEKFTLDDKHRVVL